MSYESLSALFPLPGMVEVERSRLSPEQLKDAKPIPGDPNNVIVPLAVAKELWRRQLDQTQKGNQ